MLQFQQKPFYQIQIHTKSFKHKSLPIRQRIQSEYLPRYWKKLKMDQKIIHQNQEDRLSKLTIKQIDRMIDMQKIKYVLNGKKNGNQQLYLDKYKPGQNKHPNVFRANFLSKINKIAIQRKIFTQQAQGFQSFYGEFDPEIIRRRQLQKQKQNIKYVKEYRSSKNKDKNKLSLEQMRNKTQFDIDDEKSISTIEYEKNLDNFDQNLIKNKSLKSTFQRKKANFDDKRLLCSRRWFDGMSTHFIQKKSYFAQNKTSDTQTRGIDISCLISRKDDKTQKRRSLNFDSRRLKTDYVASSIGSLMGSNRSRLITSSVDLSI